MVYIPLIPGIFAALVSIYLLYHKREGWGWFLVIAILLITLGLRLLA